MSSLGPARSWCLPCLIGSWLVVALALAGCEPLPPAPGAVPAPRAGSGATAVKPFATTSPPAPRAIAPADSLPSPEALKVLESIPEPLRVTEQVSPPAAAPAATASAAADTTAADSSAADVPVPEPTLPLGERRRVSMDSTSTSPGGAPPAAPPPATAPGATAPDTCWRVQVLAPRAGAEAERVRATASSLLLVPMVVEQESGRYKVRTRDCLTREAADLLRRRAVESGFTQAFRVSGPKR